MFPFHSLVPHIIITETACTVKPNSSLRFRCTVDKKNKLFFFNKEI